MEKLYGYKMSDVVALAEFIQKRENQSLSSIFEKFGERYGKAKGTVRNLYYALAKKSNEDKDFREKYLNGKPVFVSKIVGFGDTEERELLKKIVLEKSKGRSVRSAIMALSNGDAKLALRYQNKFRNVIKNKPNVIEEIVGELNLTDKNLVKEEVKTAKSAISNAQFERLKNEINNLIARISLKTCKENALLKEKILHLENENLRLSRALYGTEKQDLIKKFFSAREGKELSN